MDTISVLGLQEFSFQTGPISEYCLVPLMVLEFLNSGTTLVKAAGFFG